MNINTSPDKITQSSLHVTPGYMSGFRNSFETESLPGALPMGRNSPQRCAYGLYAEQFSGTAFTAPRHANRRSWLYRIRPAAVHERFRRIDDGRITSRFDEPAPSPNQLRWSPPPLPSEPTDFLAALATLGGNGSPEQPLDVTGDADNVTILVPDPGPTKEKGSGTAEFTWGSPPAESSQDQSH